MPNDSPNADIDKAIKAMMKPIVTPSQNNSIPDDIKVKIINTAIQWERVKHHIKDQGDEFNPNYL